MCALKQPGPEGAQRGHGLQSPGTFPFGDDAVVTARGDGEICASLSSQVDRVWLVGRSVIDVPVLSRERCHSYMDKSREIKTELNGPG